MWQLIKYKKGIEKDHEAVHESAGNTIWWSNMYAVYRGLWAVNGCDHSFLVNNAALLIGSVNN